MSPWTGALRDGETYSATRHLALSVFGADLKDAWMVMVTGLTAYFDVSGKPKEDARAYACAGFAAPVGNWTDKFEPVWLELLAEVGIPELHMTDVRARKKEGFRHLTDEIENHIMNVLADLLKNHAFKSFARVIDGDDLERIRDNGDAPLKVVGVEIMGAVDRWRTKRLKRGKPVGKEPRVEVIFDDGEQGKGALVDAVSGKYPIFERSIDFPPLQAADWLAWELARLNYEHKKHKGHGGPKPIRVRGPVWHAVRHLPRDWKYYHNGDWVNIFMD